MSGVPGFTIDVAPEGDGARTKVVVTGDVDVATSPRVAETLREQLAAGPVLLDLSGVVFMDSSGVRMLDRALRASADLGHELVIDATLARGVIQVLELTGMLSVLPLTGDAGTA